MSYARFSSLDWKCQVYAYEDFSGYVIHVADTKLASEVTPITASFNDDPVEYVRQMNAQLKDLEDIERVPIGLPHDGERFDEPNAAHALERMQELRAIGYVIPDYAIEALEEEVLTVIRESFDAGCRLQAQEEGE